MSNPSVGLPFIVKICGITNEADARVAVESGANALGFNFYPESPRYVTPLRAREIVKSVPGAYLKVGVFVNPSLLDLKEIAAEVPLDVLQLHGLCPSSLDRDRVWRSIHPGSPLDCPTAEAYLMDAPGDRFGGSGRTFDWSLAASVPARIILAGGLDAANVAEAIRIAQPWGVDACSRLESTPGKKDPRRVRDFVRLALAAIQFQEVSL